MIDYYQSHRHRLIVSADDFGISPRANRNIRHLISLGKIDRVGVMAYGKFEEGEIDELIRSGVKIDIHLDVLHQFHDQREARKGAFFRGVGFLGKLISRKLSSQKIEDDWRSQIEKFKEVLGKNPDGISSHEHVHFFPPFFKVALKLQHEYSIPYIRFGENAFVSNHRLIAYILRWLTTINRKTCQKESCVSSGAFVSLDWISDIDKFLDNLPDGTIEIACHPEVAHDFVRIKQYF